MHKTALQKYFAQNINIVLNEGGAYSLMGESRQHANIIYLCVYVYVYVYVHMWHQVILSVAKMT